MARYEVEVLPWAIDDAREAYLHLLQRDERLPNEFSAASLMPCEHSLRRHTTTRLARTLLRRCPLEMFPHGIMYELQEHRVIVYAVAHPKREPGFWKKR